MLEIIFVGSQIKYPKAATRVTVSSTSGDIAIESVSHLKAC